MPLRKPSLMFLLAWMAPRIYSESQYIHLAIAIIVLVGFVIPDEINYALDCYVSYLERKLSAMKESIDTKNESELEKKNGER